MNLSQRSTQSERMDTDCVDFDDYSRCLRDLSRVNIVTMTHRPTLSWLARHATGNFSVLDVACGRGDALRKIRRRFPDAEADRYRSEPLGLPSRERSDRPVRPDRIYK